MRLSEVKEHTHVLALIFHLSPSWWLCERNFNVIWGVHSKLDFWS